MRLATRIGACAVAIAVGIAAVAGAFAQSASPMPIAAPNAPVDSTRAAAPIDEYLVKAAFLYNFAKLTEWPAAKKTGGRFLLCVLGADPFAGALDAIAGKTVGERVVAVIRGIDATQAQQCHLVFIGESEAARLSQHLDVLRDRPVLTVSDLPNFSRAGGLIGLKVVDARIRFAVNVAAARRVGLVFSSRLLQLAEIVGPAASGPAASGPSAGGAATKTVRP
jgi:hypothetical protein